MVQEGTKQPPEEELITHCKGKLAGYKCPKQIFFADALPRNATGKVLKNALRDTQDSMFIEE